MLCRSNFKDTIYHQQTAALVHMPDLGRPEATLQSHKYARPGMKLTSKEDKLMGVVSQWWNDELAPEKCWVQQVVVQLDVYHQFAVLLLSL